MTKTFKSLCAIIVCALAVLTLASCSAQKQYDKYAEKIRVAEAKGEAITYAEVIDKLGQPTLNATASILGSGETGYAVWYADCADLEEVSALHEQGKSVPYIQITFAGGKATNAESGTSTPDEK